LFRYDLLCAPQSKFPLSLAVDRGAVHNRAAVPWECSTALHRFRISSAISSELQREEQALDGNAIISIIACRKDESLAEKVDYILNNPVRAGARHMRQGMAIFPIRDDSSK